MDNFNFEHLINQINKTVWGWAEIFAANLPNLLVAIVLMGFFYFLSKILTRWIKKLLDRSHLHASMKLLLLSLIKIFIIVFGIFFALGIVGLDKTVVSLMAGVGVIGLALGFAFKDLASNLISGLFIAVQNPFDIGDSITIKDISGVVETIRLRDTILVAAAGQKIYIPNKTFMEEALFNFTQAMEKKIDLGFNISYEDDLGSVIETLKRDLAQLPNLKKNKNVLVQVKEFGQNAVRIEVSVWIDVPGVDVVDFTNRVLIDIKSSLQRIVFTYLPFKKPFKSRATISFKLMFLKGFFDCEEIFTIPSSFAHDASL